MHSDTSFRFDKSCTLSTKPTVLLSKNLCRGQGGKNNSQFFPQKLKNFSFPCLYLYTGIIFLNVMEVWPPEIFLWRMKFPVPHCCISQDKLGSAAVMTNSKALSSFMLLSIPGHLGCLPLRPHSSTGPMEQPMFRNVLVTMVGRDRLAFKTSIQEQAIHSAHTQCPGCAELGQEILTTINDLHCDHITQWCKLVYIEC
jgi:hypothetical protein